MPGATPGLRDEAVVRFESGGPPCEVLAQPRGRLCLVTPVLAGPVSPGAAEHAEPSQKGLLNADRRAREVEELVWVLALDDRELQDAGRAPAALRALVRRSPEIPQIGLHSQSGPQLQEKASLAGPLVSEGVRRARRQYAWGSRRQRFLLASQPEAKLARGDLEALFLA